MRELNARAIDGHYVAAQIRLLRQLWQGAILVLEGETDAKVFGNFIDDTACQIEIAFGKANLCSALDLLEDEGFSGVLGIVDADFDRITGETYALEGLCVTDLHDLDLVIFASTSFDRYLAEHGNSKRVEASFKGDLEAIRSIIVNSCSPIACARLVSERQNLRLYFKDIKHSDFIDRKTLAVDETALIKALIDRSATRCTTEDLKTYIEREKSRSHDPYQLASGHDVAAVFGIALRELLGDRRDAHTWADEIEAGLRLAFDWDAFSNTGLHRCLRAWERANNPYRIFKVRAG
jgi:hypothetical protein